MDLRPLLQFFESTSRGNRMIILSQLLDECQMEELIAVINYAGQELQKRETGPVETSEREVQTEEEIVEPEVIPEEPKPYLEPRLPRRPLDIKLHQILHYDYFQCAYCPKSFVSQSFLDFHINRRHPTNTIDAPNSHLSLINKIQEYMDMCNKVRVYPSKTCQAQTNHHHHQHYSPPESPEPIENNHVRRYGDDTMIITKSSSRRHEVEDTYPTYPNGMEDEAEDDGDAEETVADEETQEEAEAEEEIRIEDVLKNRLMKIGIDLSSTEGISESQYKKSLKKLAAGRTREKNVIRNQILELIDGKPQENKSVTKTNKSAKSPNVKVTLSSQNMNSSSKQHNGSKPEQLEIPQVVIPPQPQARRSSILKIPSASSLASSKLSSSSHPEKKHISFNEKRIEIPPEDSQDDTDYDEEEELFQEFLSTKSGEEYTTHLSCPPANHH